MTKQDAIKAIVAHIEATATPDRQWVRNPHLGRFLHVVAKWEACPGAGVEMTVAEGDHGKMEISFEWSGNGLTPRQAMVQAPLIAAVAALGLKLEACFGHVDFS